MPWASYGAARPSISLNRGERRCNPAVGGYYGPPEPIWVIMGHPSQESHLTVERDGAKLFSFFKVATTVATTGAEREQVVERQ